MTPFVVPSIFTATDKFSATMGRMERHLRNISASAFAVGRNALMMSVALAAPLIIATKHAVDFEDKMADVGKTTGMEGKVLEKFGDSILDMSTKTRTSIDDLVKIGEIGGQLGVAEDQLLSFVDSSNKFNVALGADFSGGVEEAITAIGNIKSLFKGTRGLDISDAIQRTGSAINELGAVGSGTSSNISDFTLRLGALPDALKPSVENTLALGTFLEELGINAQIGAGGVSNLLLVAGKNIAGFGTQMGVSSDAAKELLAQDPVEFMKKFSKSFEGMAPDVLAKKLDALGIGSQETIKVIGAISASTDRLTTLQGVANQAFAEGTSLQNEYNKKNATSAALWGIMKNNLHSASITIGQALLPVLTDLLQSITPMIKAFGTWAKAHKPMLGFILKIVAGMAAFSGAIAAVSFGIGGFTKIAASAIQVFTFLKSNTIAATAVQWLYNAAMAANPVFLMVAGFAALGLAVYGIARAFSRASAEEQLNAEIKERVLDNTADQRAEVAILFEKLRRLDSTTQAYSDTLKQIDAIQPGITEKYNLQAGAVENINRAEKELIDNIMKRAEAEVRAELLHEKIKAKMEKEQEIGEMGWFDQAMEAVKFTTTGQTKFGEVADLDKQIGSLTDDIVSQEMRRADFGAETSDSVMKKKENLEKTMNIKFDVSGLPPWLKALIPQEGGGSAPMPQSSSTR